MKFTLSQWTITWEIKNSQNTIDLIFMFSELTNKIEHCKTRSEINQSFDHISIFTKLLLDIVSASITFQRAWKLINAEKVKKEKKDIFDKKFKNKTTNRRQHKKITKILDKNYWQNSFISKNKQRKQIVLISKLLRNNFKISTISKKMN